MQRLHELQMSSVLLFYMLRCTFLSLVLCLECFHFQSLLFSCICLLLFESLGPFTWQLSPSLLLLTVFQIVKGPLSSILSLTLAFFFLAYLANCKVS